MTKTLIDLLDFALMRGLNPHIFPISEETLLRFGWSQELWDKIKEKGTYKQPLSELEVLREAAIGKTYIVDLYELAK